MPGLPRNDTRKRFKKLLKSSGKSKTNTMYGATDISKKKISTYDPGESMITKFNDFLKESAENEDLDLQTSVREYLLNEYPGDWWNTEFSDRVNDYVDEDEYVGDGDPDDDSTWEYSGAEEAYQNLCNGGAIEYDLIEDIRQDICKKFNLTNDEYFKKGIDDIVEDHMCNVCDWWDSLIFGKSGKDKGKNPFDMSPNLLDTSDLPKMDTRNLKDKLEDLEKSKDENGFITLKDGSKLKI